MKKNIYFLIILFFYPLNFSYSQTNYSELIQQGNDYYKQGEYNKAIEFYQKALELNSEDYMVYYNIAYIYIKIQKYDAAKYNITLSLQKKSDFTKGIDLNKKIDEYLAKSETEGDQLKNEGINFYKENNFEQAIKCWEKISKSYSQYEKIEEFIKRAKYKIEEMEKEKERIIGEPEDITFPQDASPKVINPNWLIGVEIGAGKFFSAFYEYKKFGVISGVDFGQIQIDEKNYSSSLFEIAAFYDFNIFSLGNYSINLRPKFGWDYSLMDHKSTTAWVVAAEFLAGIKNFYAILSPSYIITVKENFFLFQLGIGFRFNW